MPRKHHKLEEIVSKLRQVDVLHSQGRNMAEERLQVRNLQSMFQFRSWARTLKSGRVDRPLPKSHEDGGSNSASCRS